jgi:DNA-binding FadR family transcriptional regulator
MTSDIWTSKADSNDPFQPKVVVRPRQQVEGQIRSAILTGELGVGARLPSEAELARRFGVSRNTVREALGSLVTQNLIQKSPGAGGGSFVRSVDHRSLGQSIQESMSNLVQLGRIDFDELSAMRQFLEVPAVRLAAVHRTEAELAELRSIVQREKVQSSDDPSVADLDVLFHSTIAKSSRNRLLATFVGSLHQETEPISYIDLSPEVGRTAWNQHVNIVDSIESGDPDQAELAMVKHLEYLRHQIGDSLATNDTDPSKRANRSDLAS